MEIKVVLLTGGSTGIGLQVANQLMDKNIRVYSASRRTAASCKSRNCPGEIIPVQMDVNNENEISDVIFRILLENRRLDAVICNAGNGVAGSVEDTSVEEMKYQFETNFFGSVKTIQACLPIFRSQGYGRIMVTSSVAAVVPIPYQAFYSAGKSALLTFIQALAIEIKPFGIECCAVLPGDTKTEFTTARRYTEKSLSGNSAYKERMRRSVRKIEKDEEKGMKPEFVAQKMVREIVAKRKMKAIVIPGTGYWMACGLFHIFPVKCRMWITGKLYN